MAYRVDIRHDRAAGVFVAISPDLPGLVIEAATLDELKFETETAAQILLSLARTHFAGVRTRCDT